MLTLIIHIFYQPTTPSPNFWKIPNLHQLIFTQLQILEECWGTIISLQGLSQIGITIGQVFEIPAARIKTAKATISATTHTHLDGNIGKMVVASSLGAR